MGIYLDDQTRVWIERLVKRAPEDFIKDRFVSMLVADRKRVEEIGRCEHEYGEYHGVKHCCKKCLTTPAGYGEDWELAGDFEPEAYKILPEVEKDPDLGI